MTALLDDLNQYIAGFERFVIDSPSSFHAAAAVAALLEAQGFTQLYEGESWPNLEAEDRRFVIRDGAIIAWRAGKKVSPISPVRVIGSHTDSPGLQLKPNPDFTAAGLAQAGVEIYGGPLLSTWFDRDLKLAGRIVTADATEHLVHTQAFARVPSLAIHLDREVNNSQTIDRQRHMQPVIGAGENSVMRLLADAAGVKLNEITGVDVRFADAQAPERLGAHGELFSSPRLDNLTSLFASVVALIEAEPAPGTISVLASFDHEELGSETRSGARGPILEDVLIRLRAALGGNAGDGQVAMHHSWCLSADAGHGVHPNYSDKHDPNVRPVLGGGPMLKVNATQRYATDAHGASLWHRCCDAAGVASQVFVANNQIASGSTIGPLTATRLGIRTVDVGVPLLSMHSIRELAHVNDLHNLARVCAAFVSGA